MHNDGVDIECNMTVAGKIKRVYIDKKEKVKHKKMGKEEARKSDMAKDLVEAKSICP